jgi:hypothetical protein
MKKTLMWCLIGLLSLGSATWARAQQTDGMKHRLDVNLRMIDWFNQRLAQREAKAK